jgi:CRISPR-associated protein Cas2
MLYLICYDIVAPKRLAKIAKTLLGYGQRVQYSVFECDLSEQQYSTLQRKLAKLMNVQEGDSLRTYRLCNPCAKSVAVIGRGPPPETTPDLFVV